MVLPFGITSVNILHSMILATQSTTKPMPNFANNISSLSLNPAHPIATPGSLSPRAKLTVSLTNVRSISLSLSASPACHHIAAETAAMSPSAPVRVRPSEEAGFPIAVDQSEAAARGESQRRIAGQRAVRRKRARKESKSVPLWEHMGRLF